MRYIIITIVVLVSLPISAQFNESLQRELIAMQTLDQTLRKVGLSVGFDKLPQASRDEISRADRQHSQRLKEIVQRFGWVNKSMVGVDGVAAAFVIIQHSPDVTFQQSMLPYLKRSFQHSEAISGQQLALLTDRILIRLGKPQRYGTQFDVIDAKVVFKSIRDPDSVDERRRELNMPSLDCYSRLVEELYGLKDHTDIEL